MLSNGIIFGLLGLIIGFVLSLVSHSSYSIILVGIVGGFLWGAISVLSKRQLQLRNRVKQLEDLMPASNEVSDKVEHTQENFDKSNTESISIPPEPKPELVTYIQPDITTTKTAEPTPATPTKNTPEPLIVNFEKHIRSFFTEGNVLVKVGLIILFFGVAFLLKYASENSLLPIELRLAGVALGGIALLVFGWSLRNKKELFALLLQGGGIGILYLTIYASSKLYSLLPHSLSFGLMLFLVILSSILAILQNAKSLAQYGAAGGFLAPILLSTGTGSHVMLFSYYLLLNIGILTVAWFYSWRSLNLLGFLFTFIIGTTWGALNYAPEHFYTVEPFLIIFFILFTAISILFATKQPPELKGYVDGTLVFGLPVIAFALQAIIVERFEYGLALSAFALSAFYIILASILWKRQSEGMSLLCEVFLASGVIFGSLTIPLALDSQWSSAAWSIEGVGLLWIGLRQKRLLARCFGILLLFGGGILFINDVSCSDNLAIINACFFGAVVISISALLSSYLLTHNTDTVKPWEKTISLFLFVWGFIWWYINGLNEIFSYSSDENVPLWLLIFATGTMLSQFALAKKLNWQQMYAPLYLFLPILWITFGLALFINDHPFLELNWLGWAIGFTGLYYLLYSMDKIPKIKGINFLHMASFWLLTLIFSVEATKHVAEAIPENLLWSELAWILFASLIIYTISNLSQYIRWPIQSHYELYLSKVCFPIVLILILVITVMGIGNIGSPEPLGYFPLLNPLDISIALGLIVIFNWHYRLSKLSPSVSSLIPPKIRLKLFAVSVFLWLTGIVARTIHYWFDVAFTKKAMFESVVFQTSISVFWTVLALTITIIASRQSNRYIWFSGAGLLGVVIAKLFLIDLANTGTIGQIVSFVAVGLLMLIIGYFSPLPPSKEKIA